MWRLGWSRLRALATTATYEDACGGGSAMAESDAAGKADTVAHHAGEAVAEGAKIINERMVSSFPSPSSLIENLSDWPRTVLYFGVEDVEIVEWIKA
jgi:hypothetical protein